MTESEPIEHSEIEDINAVAQFFDIYSAGDEMTKLTGLNREDLMNVLHGETFESKKRKHSAVLGKFARTSQEALEDLMPEGGSIDHAGIRQWLENGKVTTSQGVLRPIDALSDPKLALEALGEIENIRFT